MNTKIEPSTSKQPPRPDVILVWGDHTQMWLSADAGAVDSLLRMWGGERPRVEGFSATVYDLLMAGF